MRSSRPSPLSRTLALLPPAVALVAQQANGNMFMKVTTSSGPTPIGESLDEKHRDWIEIESFDFKVENPVTFGAGAGISGGKSTASALTVSKLLDRSSPLLFLGCAAGTKYPTVTLEFTKMTGAETQATYYKITLSNVIVSSLETSSGGERASDTVALSFERIVTDYYMQDFKGTIPTSPTSTAVWNFATNSTK